MKEKSPEPLRIVLRPEQYGYDKMEKIGRITIDYSHENGVVAIIDGFEYADLPTCRENAARALAWGAAVLANLAESERLVPGGNVCSVIG